MEEKLQELRELLGEIKDLQNAAMLLTWDQHTYMPPSGTTARAEQLATLEKIVHNRFTSDRLGKLLDELQSYAAQLDYESDDASLIRVTTREYEKRHKLSKELVSELARATALAHRAWKQARHDNDFSFFQPHLKKIVALCRQEAEALEYEDHPYDALLDLYEPEMKSAEVVRIFDEMKAELIPLVQAISEKQGFVEDRVFNNDFKESKQLEFGRNVLTKMGYNFLRGRQDESAHPFTISFSPKDVRITTRVQRDRFVSAFFASVHEGGHALYEQGISSSLERTPLADPSSFGIHESQSRLWENLVGRSREFWFYFFPHLREAFPEQMEWVDLDDVYRAVNMVKPDFIRVEADEVTYNLHIFLRFEIEMMLLENNVEVADLPEIWNAKMREYLGITPPDDSLGILQDMHWAGGSVGYFPTYALGNLLSVQFYNRAVQDIPEIPHQIAHGDFALLLDWLRQNIHRHGAKFAPVELVKRVTGTTLDAKPFIAYVKKKYSELYEL